jgi:hypothetical protein
MKNDPIILTKADAVTAASIDRSCVNCGGTEDVLMCLDCQDYYCQRCMSGVSCSGCIRERQVEAEYASGLRLDAEEKKWLLFSSRR